MEKGGYMASVVQQPTLPLSQSPQLGQPGAERLNFDEKKPTRLFCAKASFNSGSFTGQWSTSNEVYDFIKSSSEPSREQQLSLIVGTGNGTLHALSVEERVFSHIMSSFGFPNRARDVLWSIHGCICKFTEEIDGQQWLTIMFSTPKGPVKELFCVMKISLRNLSTTCLVFDCQPEDLEGEDGLIASFRNAWHTKPAFRNPLGILSLLIIQCGRVSEIKRLKGDKQVLDAEIRTRSTPWTDPDVTVVRSPSDYLRTVTFAHLCYNNLLFIDNTVNFEIDIWEFVESLLQEKSSITADISNIDKRTLIEEVAYYKQWTKSRRSQLKSLQERNRVQINLITNLIAQEETSQTKIIGAVALLFAPASLVTSVFSAGLFKVDNKSWGVYLISTLVTTFVVLLLSWSYVRGYLRGISTYVKEAANKKSTTHSERRSNLEVV